MLPESGIEYRNRSGEPAKRYIVSSLGSGAALIDYDEDGDLDVYLVNGAPVESSAVLPGEPNRLYRNDGGFRFVDVTEAAGVGDRGFGLGVAVGDVDGDGLPDIYVTNLGKNRLLRNRGDGTFEDWTERAGAGDEGFGTSALFFDADGDGDLDLYVTNYTEADVAGLPLPGSRPSCVWFGVPVFCGPSGLRGEPDVYYRNDGGTFTEAAREAGLFDATGAYGLGVVAGDYDSDGDLDLYVANDSVPNFLYQNDGSGRFEEMALLAGAAYSAEGLAQAGMGVDMADLDGNGRLDLLVTNFSHDHDTLYLNVGSGLFADATMNMDFRVATWFSLGWAARIADFDNDGDHDVFVANGHVYPQADESGQKTSYRQRNQLFWNEDGRLVEKPGAPEDGMTREASSRGAAFGDLDDDGDIDVLVVDIDEEPSLLRNEVGGSSVTLRLVGTRSNRSAIGARITARVNDVARVFEVRPSGSYLSSNDARVHIGLGNERELSELVVRWPSGTEQTVPGLRAGDRAVLVEGRDLVSIAGARAVASNPGLPARLPLASNSLRQKQLEK